MPDKRPVVLTLSGNRGKRHIDIRIGDVLETKEGQHLQLIDTTTDAILKNGWDDVSHLLIDVDKGRVEAYLSDLDEIWRYYDIKRVVPRP